MAEEAVAEAVEDDKKPVPYSRFKEVVDERNAIQGAQQQTAQQVATLQSQLAETTRGLLAIEQKRLDQSSNNQNDTSRAALLESVKAKYGKGEAAEQVWDMVTSTVDAMLKTKGVGESSGEKPLTRDEVLWTVNQAVGGYMGQLTAAQQAHGMIQRWSHKMGIGSDEVGKINQEMTRLRNENQAWNQSLDHCARTAIFNLLDSDQIKVGTPSDTPFSNGTPFSPGSGGRPSGKLTREQSDAALYKLADTYPSLRGLPIEKLRELGGDDMVSESTGEVMTQDGMATPEHLHGSYRFTEDRRR